MFCEKCGNKLENKKCLNCGFQKFENPIPVAVALIPVIKDKKSFLLGVKRGINPKKGEMALPGGFIEIEEILDGLIREVQEECGITISLPENASPLMLKSSHPVPNRILAFYKTNSVNFDEVNFLFKTPETLELSLISTDTPLAFSLHEDARDLFFLNNLRGFKTKPKKLSEDQINFLFNFFEDSWSKSYYEFHKKNGTTLITDSVSSLKGEASAHLLNLLKNYRTSDNLNLNSIETDLFKKLV